MSSDDFVVPRFLRTPTPDEVEAEAATLTRARAESGEQAQGEPVVQSEPTIVVGATPSEASAAEASAVEASAAGAVVSDSGVNDEGDGDAVVIHLEPPIVVVETLFERVRVVPVRDRLEALIAETQKCKVFGRTGVALSISISPPTSSIPDYGINPTDIDMEWLDVEQLVAQAWNEIAIHEYFAGSRCEAWLDYDGHNLLIEFPVDHDLTVWKFTSAFRSAVEIASSH